MSIRKLLTLLLALLLFTAVSGQAQSRRAADPPLPETEYKEVTVSVTLPKAVNVVRDYGKILLSRNSEEGKLTRLSKRLKDKTDKPVVEMTVEVPKNWLTRKLGLTE
ncbi:hypothetical protein MTX78_05620 [Hymenobacter tibetensis]|uniref:Uncharacterized protein n=1 Tax=Hymenobacter tibetensis TaxID=497967 RepID=A0ABY4D4H9_9BACT|nr:hypothetical protein [Hymenobacter tibetensis]UOG76079.1 hypothetical protein MTX78_05620 [Hymenobacter tibetensis]